jgi:hypothetical protein
MKPRDGDGLVRDSKNFGRKDRGLGGAAPAAVAAGRCSKCGADVPSKAGFRFSALKCPKCGGATARK